MSSELKRKNYGTRQEKELWSSYPVLHNTRVLPCSWNCIPELSGMQIGRWEMSYCRVGLLKKDKRVTGIHEDPTRSSRNTAVADQNATCCIHPSSRRRFKPARLLHSTNLKDVSFHLQYKKINFFVNRCRKRTRGPNPSITTKVLHQRMYVPSRNLQSLPLSSTSPLSRSSISLLRHHFTEIQISKFPTSKTTSSLLLNVITLDDTTACKAVSKGHNSRFLVYTTRKMTVKRGINYLETGPQKGQPSPSSAENTHTHGNLF